MVIANDVFNRVREVHAFQNIATDCRVNLHFREFCFGEFSRLVQNVLRHCEFADIVQQCARVKCLQLFFRNFEEPSHFLRIDLRATHMTVSSLVLRIDRDGQRFNRVHVNIRHLFGVTTSLGLGALGRFEASFVKAIE